MFCREGSNRLRRVRSAVAASEGMARVTFSYLLRAESARFSRIVTIKFCFSH